MVAGRKYALELCQDDRQHRFCRTVELGEPVTDGFCVFTTGPIALGLLAEKKFREIERSYKLGNGSGFCFGPRGEWFTERERKSMHDYDLGVVKAVQWDTLLAPRLSER